MYSISLIDWLTRKVEVTLYSLPLSANATARYVWMSRVCEPHQVACPKASYTEGTLNVLSPKAVSDPIHGSHECRLRLNCGSRRVSVLERWLDIYLIITSSIRRHRRVQVAKITWRQAGGSKASFRRSLNTIIGIPFLLPLFKSSSGFCFTLPSSSNFLDWLCAKQQSSKGIASSTTLDLGHVCLRRRGQMDARVTEHQRRITSGETQSSVHPSEQLLIRQLFSSLIFESKGVDGFVSYSHNRRTVRDAMGTLEDATFHNIFVAWLPVE